MHTTVQPASWDALQFPVNPHLPRWAVDHDLWCVDTETTGLAPTRHRIAQIGIAVARDGEAVFVDSTYVDPRRPMPAEASRINGLSDDLLAGQPSFGSAWMALSARADGWLLHHDDRPRRPRLWLAHHIDFDVPFLAMEFARAGTPAEGIHAPWLCSHALALAAAGVPRKDSKGLHLSTLCALAGLVFEGPAHDAQADALMALRLLLHIAPRLPADLPAVLEMQDAWYDASRRPGD